MDPNEDLEEENNQQNRSNVVLDAAQQQGQKAVEKIAKEGIKKSTKKVAGHAVGNAATGAFSSVLTAILPYILIALVVIIVIILLIGIIAFLVTMPGMMSEKMKSFGKNIATSIKNTLFEGGTTEIKDSEVLELAQYINSMEYDLLGFGFVTPSNNSKDVVFADELKEQGYQRNEVKYTEEGIEKNSIIYKKSDGTQYSELFYDYDGTIYNGATGKSIKEKNRGEFTKYGIKYNADGTIADLKGVNTSYLRSYALSDKRIFMLRNRNENLLKNIVKLLTGYEQEKNYTSWANGLIRLYEADNSIATDEYAKSFTNLGDAFEFLENGNFKVKKGLFNNAMEYSTDGWIARYGLSQDFLISLHLATLSPELVQTIVQSYDTEIQVYLNEIDDAKAKAKMVDTASTEINTNEDGLTIADFEGRFSGIGLKIDDKSLTDLAIDIDAWYISKKEAKNFYKETGIHSPTTCTNVYEILGDHIIDNLNTDGSNNPKEYKKNLKDMYKVISDYDQPTISYNVVKNVESFIEELKQENVYGFSEEDYNYVKGLLWDNDRCAIEKAYSSDSPYNPENENDYDLNNPNIDLSCDEEGNLTREGLDIDTYLHENLDISESFEVNAYNKELGLDCMGVTTPLNEFSFGSICGFEYGKFQLGEDGEWLKKVADGAPFCTCEFCESFWNKYYAIWLETPAFSTAGYGEEYIDAEGKQYNGFVEGNNTGIEDYNIHISDIYSWEYTNEKNEVIQYNLSFYKTSAESDTIYLAVTRSWTEEEAEYAKNNYKAKDKNTCSTILHSGADTKICTSCRKHVKNIIKTLKKINDEDYSLYLPYIARVIDSWFRDTYFIIPNESDSAIDDAIKEHGYNQSELVGKNVAIIENDSEFLEGTGELWTKYMMNPDGGYALFILNTTGELLKSPDEVTAFFNKSNFTDEDKELLKDFVQSEYSNNGITGYGRWEGEDNSLSDEEKEKAKELLEKYNISLVKIPISKDLSKLEGYVDSGEIAWSAYQINKATGTVWKDIEVSDSSPKYMKKLVENYDTEKGELKLVVGLEGVYDIVQIQDAQRGITNSKIKYLFKNKKYYKYDGTVERAYAIYNDWQSCVESMSLSDTFKNTPADTFKNLGQATIKLLYRPTLFSYWNAIKDAAGTYDYYLKNLKETALNTYIDAFYYQADTNDLKKCLFADGTNFKFARDFNGDGVADIASLDCIPGEKVKIDDKNLEVEVTENTKLTNDPRNPNLISNIDLNNESLAAFSILENTKTLDADYAYRDLKELFCELDYFDKEDLTEPAKDVFEWILPDTGSAGWPNRVYDKENEYGTMIHSKSMYDMLNDILVEGANLSTKLEDNGILASSEIESNNQLSKDNSTKDDNKNTLYAMNNISSRKSTTVYIEPEDEMVSGGDGYEVIVKANGIEYKSFKQNKGTYSSIPCASSTISGDGCGITSLAIILSAYGIDTNPGDVCEKAGGSNYWRSFGELQNTAKDGYGIEFSDPIDVNKDANPGEILRDAFAEGKPALILVGDGEYNNVKYTIGAHYMVAIGVDKDGHLIIIDCFESEREGYRKGYIDTDCSIELFFEKYMYDNGYIKGFIIPKTAPTGVYLNTAKTFEGYEKYQPIVSPATAKILEIGTVEVQNEDTKKILKRFYATDEINENESENEEEANELHDLIPVPNDQYDNLKEYIQGIEDDDTNSFGKKYTTGYIKLEVIGEETMNKFNELEKESVITEETYNALKAFYSDYYNETNKKSICDSYTIYIEGIDLTGSIESNSNLNSIDETIIGEIIKSNENSSENIKLTINESDREYKINYYTTRKAPAYYVDSAKENIQQREELKESLSSVIKNNNDIYIKAGTLIGVTGDANIKIIMKDKNEGIVENVEDYLEIEDNSGIRITNVVGGEISASANGIRTEEDILYAIEKAGWNASMRANVEDMMDGLMRMQVDFDIDPLVAIALFRGESSVGTAYEGQYRLDNHKHWDGCNCSYHQSQGFACYDNYSDNAYDWGNYIRNRFAEYEENIQTWDDMANFQGMAIYENCNVDDGAHAISFYKDLIEALKSK
ncbi:MAG: C39 family peptidase [Clostridia bacterium]|nr:C39 family peptidase [Clostridia bacterium]